MSIESPYMTSEETIAYLRLGSPQALYRLINEHNLPFRRVARFYRFDRRAIDRWLAGPNDAIATALQERRRA